MLPWGPVHTAWPAREWEGRQAGSRKPPSHVGKQHRCQLLQSHPCNDRGAGWPLPDVVGRQPPAGAATGAPFRDLETQVRLASGYPGHQLETEGPQNHTRSPNIEPGAYSWPTKPALEHPEQGLNPSSTFSHHMTGKPMVHSLGFLICEMGTKQSACDPVACAVPATQKALECVCVLTVL